MGHVRLGRWPKSRKWNEVVNFIASGMAASQVAAAVIKAAEAAFNSIGKDIGYEQAAWFLIQLSEAASQKSPLDYLRTQGIDIKEASLAGIATALTNAMDDSNYSARHLSTEAEIARNALVSSVISTIASSQNQPTFFDHENNYAEEAVKKLGATRVFASMFQGFLTDFTNRALMFYLDKQLSNHLGEDQRFRTLEEKQQFRKEILNIGFLNEFPANVVTFEANIQQVIFLGNTVVWDGDEFIIIYINKAGNNRAARGPAPAGT